ncbi:MAG: DUF4112 domain-containing protein [Microthrixaceae bacterium]|nr:DUF4112 domain-containing protein [Microthrixaceae bacterium]
MTSGHDDSPLVLLRSTRALPIAVPEDAPAEGLVPWYVRRLAWMLDDSIPVGTSRRVGIDGFLSFIPGFGDAAGFGFATVVVLAGVRAGCSWVTVLRMTVIALIESTLGLIPFFGPVFSFAVKANNRNLRVIERDLADREATRRESWKVLIAVVAMFVLTVAVFVAGIAVFTWVVVDWLFGG